MKMCSKLGYHAFSSSSSKDCTMSHPCGVFLHYLLKFKPLDGFSVPKRDCKSLCVCGWSVCVHLLNKDFSQAAIGTFNQCHFQKMVGWVAFKFFFLYVEV